MKKIITILFAIAMLSTTVAFAQKVTKGKLESHYSVVAEGYNFWLYTPEDYEPVGHPSPIIIFLHGRSLCGYNLNTVLKYGVVDAINKGKVVPAIVMAPQNPGGAWSPKRINNLLEWVEQHYNVDQTRVYVLGMSLGGYGTMDFCGTYPEKVAAGMALCGGCSLKNMDGLSKLPFWIMHGTADRAVPVSASKRVVEYLEQNTKTDLLRYDWIPNGSHGILARMFYLQKTYDWLFSHSLKQNPKVLDKTFDIDASDMKQAYQELKWFKDFFEYE